MYHRIRVVVPALLLLLVSVVLSSLSGCVSRKDRSSLLKGIATEQVTLQTVYTQFADLVLTVPEGFETERVEEGVTYDKYYIFDRVDTGDTQHGMIVLDIKSSPNWIIKDTSEYTRSKGSIGKDEDVIWREAKITTDVGKVVFQREMIQEDLLRSASSSVSDNPLFIHAFVVGSDSLLVERLTASVESIVVKPRGNL
jgi:hypothetical protein